VAKQDLLSTPRSLWRTEPHCCGLWRTEPHGNRHACPITRVLQNPSVLVAAKIMAHKIKVFLPHSFPRTVQNDTFSDCAPDSFPAIAENRMTVKEDFTGERNINRREEFVDNWMEKTTEESRENNHKDTVEARSELDEKRVTHDDLLEEVAIECAAEGYVLKYQLELAIDEHLRLQSENEILQKLNVASTRNIEQENHQLTLENKSLLEELRKTKKEIHACKSVLEILEKEKRQAMKSHQVVDLTSMPDHL
jgi:hypothetical protein